ALQPLRPPPPRDIRVLFALASDLSPRGSNQPTAIAAEIQWGSSLIPHTTCRGCSEYSTSFAVVFHSPPSSDLRHACPGLLPPTFAVLSGRPIVALRVSPPKTVSQTGAWCRRRSSVRFPNPPLR